MRERNVLQRVRIPDYVDPSLKERKMSMLNNDIVEELKAAKERLAELEVQAKGYVEKERELKSLSSLRE